MDRQPLLDQFPYRFHAPKFDRFWWHAGRLYNTQRFLRREQRVLDLEVQGAEHLKPLLDRGDGVLIAPNHPDNADAATLFETSHRVGRPFAYLAGYQLFEGMARFILPRVGAFPIDREGADLKAFRTGVEILTRAVHPLVIFPEGEIYHTCDRLTPLREGAVAFASTAAKRLAESGRTVWIVPTAVKYRFLDHVDPMPALVDLMDRLEARFTWWPRSDLGLVERIYVYAEGLLGLKELELLGAARTGPLKERIADLRDSILDRIEDKRVGKRRIDTVPVRIKELRRVCLEALSEPGVDRRPGHGELPRPERPVRRPPTLQLPRRLRPAGPDARTDRRDPAQVRAGHPGSRGRRAPGADRRAIVRFGEPIDVARRLAELGKPRVANGRITAELEARIQAILDSIGPGRPIADPLDVASEVPVGGRRGRGLRAQPAGVLDVLVEERERAIEGVLLVLAGEAVPLAGIDPDLEGEPLPAEQPFQLPGLRDGDDRVGVAVEDQGRREPPEVHGEEVGQAAEILDHGRDPPIVTRDREREVRAQREAEQADPLRVDVLLLREAGQGVPDGHDPRGERPADRRGVGPSGPGLIEVVDDMGHVAPTGQLAGERPELRPSDVHPPRAMEDQDGRVPAPVLRLEFLDADRPALADERTRRFGESQRPPADCPWIMPRTATIKQ